MIQLSIVYSVAALKVLPGQLLFNLGIFSKGVFLKTVENSLPTALLHTQNILLNRCGSISPFIRMKKSEMYTKRIQKTTSFKAIVSINNVESSV